MKKFLFTLSALAIAVLSLSATRLSAQDCGCSQGCDTGCNAGCAGPGCHDKVHNMVASRMRGGPGIIGADGMTQPVDTIVATNPVGRDTLGIARSLQPKSSLRLQQTRRRSELDERVEPATNADLSMAWREFLLAIWYADRSGRAADCRFSNDLSVGRRTDDKRSHQSPVRQRRRQHQ